MCPVETGRELEVDERGSEQQVSQSLEAKLVRASTPTSHCPTPHRAAPQSAGTAQVQTAEKYDDAQIIVVGRADDCEQDLGLLFIELSAVLGRVDDDIDVTDCLLGRRLVANLMEAVPVPVLRERR